MGGAGLAGVGLLGVGACGGGGSSGALRWSMWSDTPEETKVWKSLAEDVHEKNPDITVRLETVTFADYWDKLSTQIASENEADVVAMQSLRMPGFAVRGALQPLARIYRRRFRLQRQGLLHAHQAGAIVQGRDSTPSDTTRADRPLLQQGSLQQGRR